MSIDDIIAENQSQMTELFYLEEKLELVEAQRDKMHAALSTILMLNPAAEDAAFLAVTMAGSGWVSRLTIAVEIANLSVLVEVSSSERTHPVGSRQPVFLCYQFKLL